MRALPWSVALFIAERYAAAAAGATGTWERVELKVRAALQLLFLLLFTPLCLLLLHGGWTIARGRAAGQAFRVLAWLVAAGAVLALFLHWLPVLPQRNVHWIALMLPIHVALAWTLAARPRD